MNSLLAGNFHLILVKIFLYLDGRTLTSASKVGSCEDRELLNAVEHGVFSKGALFFLQVCPLWRGFLLANIWR